MISQQPCLFFCFSFSRYREEKKRKNGHTRGIRREEKDSRCLDAFIAIFALDRRGKRALRSAVRLPSMLEVEGSLPLDLPTTIPGCGSRFLVVEGRGGGAGSNGGEACRQRVAGGGGKARVSSRDTPGVEFSKRTALNGHERVFRSSVPAHAYIYIYVYMYPRLIRKKHNRDAVGNSHHINCNEQPRHIPDFKRVH